MLSESAEIRLPGKLHLDHFYYRIPEEDEGRMRTYDSGRLVHDVQLFNLEESWEKITFPQNHVSIDTIVFSKGIQIDNISMLTYTKVQR